MSDDDLKMTNNIVDDISELGWYMVSHGKFHFSYSSEIYDILNIQFLSNKHNDRPNKIYNLCWYYNMGLSNHIYGHSIINDSIQQIDNDFKGEIFNIPYEYADIIIAAFEDKIGTSIWEQLS